ncbi:MAG: group 1 truncated hemoglobin [Verrucomicrobiota bacterium]
MQKSLRLALMTALASTFALPGFAEKKKAEGTNRERAKVKTRDVDPNSIYARIGGDAAINAAVDLFYKKVLADDHINHFFEDVNMKGQHIRQKAFFSAVLGGPKPWTGKNMRRAHKHLDLEESHFNAVAKHLSATLKDLKVDQKLIDEVMTLVGTTKDDVLNRKKPKKKKKKG